MAPDKRHTTWFLKAPEKRDKVHLPFVTYVLSSPYCIPLFSLVPWMGYCF